MVVALTEKNTNAEECPRSGHYLSAMAKALMDDAELGMKQ